MIDEEPFKVRNIFHNNSWFFEITYPDGEVEYMKNTRGIDTLIALQNEWEKRGVTKE